jgi:lipid-A-disaccharide synthase-like uncharacterized protein
MQNIRVVLVLLLFIAAALLTVVHTQQNEDKITSLPGYSDNIPFNQYAGYLLANETNGRFLFYWFMESQNSPSTDPVVLWMVCVFFVCCCCCWIVC